MVRNLITFSIVFTNKDGMDRFNPQPPPTPIQYKENKRPIKSEVNVKICYNNCQVSL